ncbi:MAG: hypothetical protein HKN39_04700 [Flavobacteriales bacterium]|nr:hypothetical protein [Flavobacteriales bacterium]
MCFPLMGMSQLITGDVVDAITGEKMGAVNIIEKNQKIGTSADVSGNFQLRSRSWSGELHFSHIGYSSQTVKFDRRSFSEGHLVLRIELMPGIDLPESVIGSRPKPEVVFQNRLRHVAEFEFLDNLLVVLSYTTQKSFRSQDKYDSTILKEAMIFLADNEENILDSLYLGTGEFALEKTFRETVLLIDENDVKELKAFQGKLNLDKISYELYKDFFSPTVDSLDQVYYVSTFDQTFPAFEYFTFDNRDSSYSRIKYICDELGMEFMRSEYKYLSGPDKVKAMNLSKRLGVDKKVIAAYMNGFQSTQYFKKPNAPLFLVNDTILIFDHLKGRMYRMNKWNSVLDSVEFGYHKKLWFGDKYVPNREWQGELYLDLASEEISTSFLRNGYCYLRKIDLSIGKLSDPFRLAHRYVEEIELKDGYAFYIYRPFESSQKKYLYKEKVY